ncbi:MAG: TIGR03546 family protein, partial [Pirellulaceae bacterium]|nr:TIGR03546 family protein [Pirellulaceae bacterium]
MSLSIAGIYSMWLIKQLRNLRSALKTSDTPRQLALGFAFGLLLGLVPKGNLLACAIGVTMFATRGNLSVAIVTAFGVSFLSGSLDNVAHGVGAWFLRAPSLEGLWRSLEQTPYVPWTRFNNTVVLGSFVLGAAAFYPAYCLSLPFFANYWPRKRVEEDDAAEPATDRAEQQAADPPAHPVTAEVDSAETTPDEQSDGAETPAENEATPIAAHATGSTHDPTDPITVATPHDESADEQSDSETHLSSDTKPQVESSAAESSAAEVAVAEVAVAEVAAEPPVELPPDVESPVVESPVIESPVVESHDIESHDIESP